MGPPVAVVVEIELAAKSIEPASTLYRNRRIFSDRDHDLFDHTGDYTAQVQALDNDRTLVVAKIYRAAGIAGVIELARQAASPYKAGEALGRDATLAAEGALLPTMLASDDPSVGQEYYCRGPSPTKSTKTELNPAARGGLTSHQLLPP